MAFIFENLYNSSRNLPGVPALFSYATDTDDINQVIETDYFDDERVDLANGDAIFCTCTDGNVLVWSGVVFNPLQGPPGPPGPQGPQGIQGIQGIPGDDGTNGLDGLDGLDGIDGMDGVQGIQGPPGENGLDGEDGETGAQGIQGIQGIQGPTGLTGDPGDDGDDGAQGIQGPPGIQGIQGIQGIPGDDGLDGNDGADGAQGPPGDDGLDGDQGIQGTQGIQGIQGIQGPPGPLIFGTEFVAEVRDTIEVTIATPSVPGDITTGTFPEVYLSLTTPDLPSGDYLFFYDYTWNHDGTVNDFVFRINRDSGTEFFGFHREQPFDANGVAAPDAPAGSGSDQRFPIGLKAQYYPSLSGIHTFDMEFGTAVGSVESTMITGRMLFWRVG